MQVEVDEFGMWIVTLECGNTHIQIKEGSRVQRAGWQLTALGTVKRVFDVDDEIFLIVHWDYRGMDDDFTTMKIGDIIPAEHLDDVSAGIFPIN